MDYLRKIIRESLLEHTSECDIKITKEIFNEINKFNTSEELLRAGGLSIEALDRVAHGFSEEDVKTLKPEQLKVRWKDDLENVKWEIERAGINPKIWAKKVDLSEPIDVDYWEDDESGFKKGFYIQDGHHRYYAAKILGKPLNVNLEIKINPIKELCPTLSYDDFHRYLFNKIKKYK